MRMTQLKTIADIQTGPFGSQLHKEDYIETGTPIVTVEHLGNRVFTEQNLPRVSDSDKARLIKYTLSTGDIVFSRVGSVDRCSYVDKSHDGWMFSGRCLRVRPTELVDSLYLYYYFCLEETKQFVRNIAVGATMPSINTKLLGEVEIALPDLNNQKRIAAVLSSLDDKIENNQKLNDNLYAQAKAIFDNHFINIDAIPAGWRKGNLLDIANYLNGLAMQKFRPQGHEIGLPVLKIKELRQGSCDDSSELCSLSIKPEYIIHNGDVVFSWSGSLLVDIWCGGTCGLNQHLFKVTSDVYDKWFYYLWTAHHLARFIAIAADKATTMGHIKREELAKAEVLIPCEEDYTSFNSIMQPIFELIISNRIESRKLAALRDELLPKLMTGEIDISDVQL